MTANSREAQDMSRRVTMRFRFRRSALLFGIGSSGRRPSRVLASSRNWRQGRWSPRPPSAQPRTTTGPARLSRDQIAAFKGSEGWGQVFSQMKTEGIASGKESRPSGKPIRTSDPRLENWYDEPERPHRDCDQRPRRATTFTSAQSASTPLGGMGDGHGVVFAHANTNRSATHPGGSSHGAGMGHGR